MAKRYKDYCLEEGSPTVVSGVGKNIIPPPEKESLWKGFLEKFKDPLIIVLLVVFVFSVGVSLYEIFVDGRTLASLIEPMGVLIALLLATGVGFIFEVRAEKEFRILNKKKDERPVKVLRWQQGANKQTDRPQMTQIKKSDVVVGDVVRLENGDEVPADGELIDAISLMVDESAFTGEMYATKTINKDPISTLEGTAYSCDFLLRGSTVIEGHCLYRVTAIGMDTEEGQGARILQEEDNVKTPLNKQLDQLGSWITKASYLIAILIVAGRLVYYFFFDGNSTNNTDIIEILSFTLNSIMIAVTLIVVAVPEGLPMSVTISLALSMKKMLKENNLVRKLHACETMGAVTVICTDKTGTLTKNRLRVMEDSEELYVDLITVAKGISVNSTAELTICPGSKRNVRSVGNPTEGSLLYWLNKKKLEGKVEDYQVYRDNTQTLKQVSFTPETKYMETIAKDNQDGKTYRYLKGAPEIVLDMCDIIAGGKTREQALARLNEMQSIGRRTLAFAQQEIVEGIDTPLVFIGFVGMADPIRKDVRDAIDTCHKAGVNIIMVTGDVALTANEVARQTGIITNDAGIQIITGKDFAEMSDEDIKQNVLPTLKVLSRARPADKARLVTLLQETNQVVAVTGDGTNDAPALKKAQVGLSMGDGTSRAKEASDITIIDNSFASINTAILWGRSLYLNIRRFIVFQMTINVCACLIVLFGAFMGLDSPLNVTQMLWVNLIMDTFAAMALSSLPADSRVMKDKPRNPDSQIINAEMAKQILGFGLLFFMFLFGLWQLLWHTDIQSIHDFTRSDTWSVYFSNFLDFSKAKQHLSEYELGIFFTFFVMLQFWNLFNARYFRTGRSLLQDIFDGLRSPKTLKQHYSVGFIAVAFTIICGQLLIVNVLGEMFGVSALSWHDWIWLMILTSPILILADIYRCVKSLFR